MSLFDWLTDAIGGSGSMPPVQSFDMNRPTGPMPPAQGLDVKPSQLAMPPAQGLDMPMPQQGMGPAPGAPPPMPPAQGLDLPSRQPQPMPPVQGMDLPPRQPPPMPPAQGLETNGSPVQMTGDDAARLPPERPQIPMPRPRPAPVGPAAMPQQPLSIQPGIPQGGIPQQPDQQGGGNSSLSRALGLNPQTGERMMSGLGAGLRAAGNSAGKSPFQAFASGAGETIGGVEARQDKTYDQKLKYLQAAVAAQSAGDKAAYNKNYAAYLTGKLQADTEKAASSEAGKKGAWNKPDSQKFIDAQHALSKDPEIHASQKLLEQTAKSGEPAEIAKAQAAHNALIKDKEAKYLSGVGLNPQKLADLQKNPPGTRGNPHVVASQQDFDAYVKPGDAYVNPKDGKTYIRKGGAASGGGESAPPQAAAPSSPPAPPGPAPRGSLTEDED